MSDTICKTCNGTGTGQLAWGALGTCPDCWGCGTNHGAANPAKAPEEPNKPADKPWWDNWRPESDYPQAAAAPAQVAEPNIAFVKEYLSENGQRGYLKQLEQYEAIHTELLEALKSLIRDVSAGNREAAKEAVAKAEPRRQVETLCTCGLLEQQHRNGECYPDTFPGQFRFSPAEPAAQPVSAQSPEIPEESSDLTKSLASLGTHLTITSADSLEGRRIVAGWKDEQVREFAANWIARADARQRLADDAISALRTAREERASTHTVYVNPEGMNKAEAREMVAQLYRELQAAREEFQALLNKLDAEREARKQAEVEHARALEALRTVRDSTAVLNHLDRKHIDMIEDVFAKPVSGSPER